MSLDVFTIEEKDLLGVLLGCFSVAFIKLQDGNAFISENET